MKKLFAIAFAVIMLVTCFAVITNAADVISAGKTITSTYPDIQVGDSTTVAHPLALALDGDKTIVHTTCCYLKWTADGYIEIDLGASYEITGYTLYNYLYAAQYCINSEWHLDVSEDGKTFKTVNTAKLPVDPKTIATVGYENSATGDTNTFDAVTGRYVRLYIDKVYAETGTNFKDGDTKEQVRIYEIEILGKAAAAAPATTTAAPATAPATTTAAPATAPAVTTAAATTAAATTAAATTAAATTKAPAATTKAPTTAAQTADVASVAALGLLLISGVAFVAAKKSR